VTLKYASVDFSNGPGVHRREGRGARERRRLLHDRRTFEGSVASRCETTNAQVVEPRLHGRDDLIGGVPARQSLVHVRRRFAGVDLAGRLPELREQPVELLPADVLERRERMSTMSSSASMC
jgi:hypothetical protein